MGKALLFALAAVPVCAQDWTPSKIVAMSEYPKVARLARVQGTVEVKCTLDSSGNVTAAEMISGNALLGKPASDNALKWKFQPVSKEVPGNSVTLRYVFLLEGTPQDATNSTFVFEMPNRIQMVAPGNDGIIKGAP
jgi:TonB family protein